MLFYTQFLNMKYKRFKLRNLKDIWFWMHQYNELLFYLKKNYLSKKNILNKLLSLGEIQHVTLEYN